MFGDPVRNEKGFPLTALKDCCVINPRKSGDKSLRDGMEVSFVPMTAVSEKGAIDLSEIRLYEEVKMGFTYFAENDVLFAKITPCMENGKGAIAEDLCNGVGFGSTEFHVLRPVTGVSNPYWIYQIMAFDRFRKDAAANMTGSAGQRRVPASYLAEYTIGLPPLPLQHRFADFVRQADKSKFVVQKATKALDLHYILNVCSKQTVGGTENVL
jgi:type I restriction enzyme S subunit